MGCPRLAARNPIAPFGIHKASIEIVGLENVHVAVENSVTLFRHRVLLCFDQSRTKKRFIVTLSEARHFAVALQAKSFGPASE
jgi:hypothetical protein